MSIELSPIVPEGTSILCGGDCIELNAAGHFIISTTGPTATILDYEIPAGKIAKIVINISCTLT